MVNDGKASTHQGLKVRINCHASATGPVEENQRNDSMGGLSNNSRTTQQAPSKLQTASPVQPADAYCTQNTIAVHSHKHGTYLNKLTIDATLFYS